ncbi:hypothetical protein BaRGS_00001693 [Batillaria attramentaria]|uniref:G-protein coupled receptors family 1 profile domain-containing protein n=1 Tax=Batillaria attramentaria TaxID=370345 RepID=A0ABD0M5S2_9CAEN
MQPPDNKMDQMNRMQRMSKFKNWIDFLQASDEEHTIRSVIDYVLGICMLLANSMAIVTIVRFDRLHTRPNMYILSLSLSDSFIGVQLILAATYRLPEYRNWFATTEDVCVTFLSAWCLFFVATMLNTLVIAVDRYMYVSSPFLYEDHVTEKRIMLLLAVLWISATLYASWPLVDNTFIPGFCEADLVLPKVMRAYTTFAIFLACLVVSGVLYARITLIAVHHRERVEAIEMTARREHGSTRKRSDAVAAKRFSTQVRSALRFLRTYKLFLCVYGLMAVCYTPYFVSEFVLELMDKITEYPEYLTICKYIALVNSGMNVFVYAYFNHDFRHAMKATLTCSRPRFESHAFDTRRRSTAANFTSQSTVYN